MKALFTDEQAKRMEIYTWICAQLLSHCRRKLSWVYDTHTQCNKN